MDRALPFGLRSAPKIFSAVADFIAWVLHCHGIAYQLHYLDDFLFLGAPHSDEAARALEMVTQVFRTLGIPIAVHKTEGPAPILVFLGIIINTQNFELRLSEEKLTRLQAQLESWGTKRFCRKHELESLLGHLSHAATVVRYGRTFLRQLFRLLASARANHHFIHLSASARADLLWWKVFLQHWNGRAFFPCTFPAVTVTSDASGSFGCGAFSHELGWFQLKWPASWNTTHIAAKELVPIVIAAALWGPHWHGRCIGFRTDNMAVVEVLHSRTASDLLLMHLLRCLVFYAAVHHFDFVGEHIPGNDDIAADALSRNNLALFSCLFPQAMQVPIPQPVLDSGQTQLGISRMDILVQGLLDQGIARSTQAVYRSGWKRYSKFCQEHSQPPLPLSEHTLCQFAAVMSQEVTWKTIRIYLSALCFFQIRAGLPDPSLSSKRAYTASPQTTNESTGSPSLFTY